MNMKKLKKGERGFTLVEMLIVILLAGIVTAAVTGTTLYVLNVNAGTANRMTAVRQVRNVGFWVSPDFQMARVVVPENNPATPELLTLTWTEFGESANCTHEVIYTLEDMPSGEFKRLKRAHYIGPDPPSITIVAEYIDPYQTSIDPSTPCSFPDCAELKYTLEVTATVGGQSETREYEVKPRPGSS